MAGLKEPCFKKDDFSFLSADLAEIEKMIQVFDENTPFAVKKAVSYMVDGGKRIRAMFVCLVGRMCGCSRDNYIKIAVAIESLHNATLLHDDVIDDASMRRSKDAVCRLWGNKVSVLSGDYLLSRSLWWMSATGNVDVVKILSKASSVIVSGEILQLSTEGDLVKGCESYFNIITAKTAVLFAAACEAVAVVAGSSSETCKLFKEFGLNTGVAFQIKDDILDYVGGNEIGKIVGKDFTERKITLPVIIAYNEGCEEERYFWKCYFSGGMDTKDDFSKALSYISKYDAIDKSTQIAKVYKNKASCSVVNFAHNAYYRYLIKLVNIITEREC
ncbi:Polyprenyl synthetase family protein [Candidatus Xenohaliotis californiensis]|uniref:Polyprenyl synthetase family protein n=1 Tax=Candidatus Xenohaliotis californiensis TaxID=84677 RepID=A0ABM9N7A6_9RICK|nr:Polyprenyl synthetase family protein [Candidatus Xenohaliotis californiensis]